MEKTKKVTKRDNFNALLEIKEVAENKQLVEFINHELELLDKKTTSKTPTKNQVENEQLKAKIIDALLDNAEGLTITDLIKIDGLEVSNQKASALMTQLKNSNKVIREMQGKKAIFKVAV